MIKLKISDNGLNLLKQWEGCVKINEKHVIYDDKTGQPVPAYIQLPPGATIGYGHLIKNGEFFRDTLSEIQATELLRRDIRVAEDAVCRNIKTNISQNQFDALVIFAFNIGVKNFTNSTVVKYINNPKFHSSVYPTLEIAWKAWNKSGGRVMQGLIQRRNEEWELFNRDL